MDKYTNSVNPGKVRKNKLISPDSINFSSNDLSILNNLNHLNQTNNLNISHLNNLNNQFNGVLPPDLFSNLNSLTNLNGLTSNLNNYNSTNTNSYSMNQLTDQYVKNAITSEFSIQSSLLYPSYQQQQSKLTLSSNITAPTFNTIHHPIYNPYLTAAIQQSLLNQNLFNNSSGIIHLNNLSDNSLQCSLTDGLNYLTEADFNQIPQLNNLNQFNKSLNLLNETFLAHSLLYPNQLSNNFNFNFLNNSSVQQQPSHINSNNNQNVKCKRPKLEQKTNDLKKGIDISDDFKSNLNEDAKNDLKDEFKSTKEEKFKELKVQTITNPTEKLVDDKKFSPDSSTELIINKQQKTHIQSINKCLNNQSPIITSTKTSSSEHSTSPDVNPLSLKKGENENIGLIENDSCKKENDKIEDHGVNCSKIDLNSEHTNDETLDSNNESIQSKKNIEYEELYSLISSKSFQLSNNFKEVSLDRMSFNEDEDEEDKSINFNFKNLIDNDDFNCSDVKDESMNKRNRSTRKRRENDSCSVNSNPWSIRRSERIFLHEAFSNNSNNCFTLDYENLNFKLTLDDLDEPQRILLQNERLTQEAIKEIKVKSIEQLHEGCRVAAFWSLKTKYLYLGRIGKLSDSLNISTNNKKGSVLVHFDDGDKTRISIDEIRLLPDNFELKQTDTDEENSSKNSNNSNEEKKVEKLKIKINTDQLMKKKKKKHSHSKDRHHRHHHKKHRSHDENEQSTEDEHLIDNNFIEEDNDEWWSKVRTDQQWIWYGKSICSKKLAKSKKSKKTFYNAIIRGDEIIKLNDCAVFLSAGRPSLPFIGRIVKMWQNHENQMIVNVRWFYHPEETRKPHPKLIDIKGALFESSGHFDDNDVQTMSHKVLVLSYADYLEKRTETTFSEDEDDIYYNAGVYDAGKQQFLSIHKNVLLKN